MESKKLVKKPVSKKKVVAKKSNHSKWPNLINNAEHLNQAVVCFLRNNEKWIHQYAEKVNPKDSAIEQLASLIVGLITNKFLVEGKHSLNPIMQAAFALAKKSSSKEPAAKKPVAKKAVAKKAVAKKPVAKKPEVKKVMIKKPVAKKPVAKKSEVKKLVAKKPVVKKAVAKKPVAKKPEVKKVMIKKPVAKKSLVKKAS